MLDSIYHMTNTLKVSKGAKIRNRYNQLISGVKTLCFCHYVRSVVMDIITFPENR